MHDGSGSGPWKRAATFFYAPASRRRAHVTVVANIEQKDGTTEASPFQHIVVFYMRAVRHVITVVR